MLYCTIALLLLFYNFGDVIQRKQITPKNKPMTTAQQLNLEANLKTTAGFTFLSLCALVDDLKVEIMHYKDKYEEERKKCEEERKKNQLIKQAFINIMID